MKKNTTNCSKKRKIVLISLNIMSIIDNTKILSCRATPTGQFQLTAFFKLQIQNTNS